MLSKKQIQFLKRLHQKKNRYKEGLFLVEGRKNVLDLLQSEIKVHSIYVTSSQSEVLPSSWTDEVIWECSPNDFQRFSYLKSPDGIAAVAHFPEIPSEQRYRKILLLEDINDPGNLGTLLRTADWFDMDAVYISSKTTDPFSPKAVQAAKGSLFRLPLYQVDLRDVLERFIRNGFSIFAMEMDGKSLDEVEGQEPFGILLGNEANGLRKETMNLATDRVRIPKASSGPIDSLNVGIAGSIAMFALTQKRG